MYFSPSHPSFSADAYCSVSGTLHPQVLQFHSQCLSLCGDIQLMLAHNANNRAAYLEEYSYQTKEDQEILHSLHRESSCQGQSLKRDSQGFPVISCVFKRYGSVVDHFICHFNPH